MSLYEKPVFDEVLGAWPGVTFVDQWEAHIAKVGGKVFCLLGDKDPKRLVFKCEEMSFDVLTELDGIAQAPYFAKRAWVEVSHLSPLTQDELISYITRSYGLVAKGLTRKLRSELGIPDDLGSF
jgi:predicted DNA-binding protein (MmcQ/YjbR family)